MVKITRKKKKRNVRSQGKKIKDEGGRGERRGRKRGKENQEQERSIKNTDKWWMVKIT